MQSMQKKVVMLVMRKKLQGTFCKRLYLVDLQKLKCH